ncbi:MAG: 30S ribosomal protein S13 [Candidatus Baldrarchaeia archaeon]
MSVGEYRHIVRIAGVDIDGSVKLVHGLSQIRGIGQRFAEAIVKVAGLDPDMRIGYLSDADIKKIEDIIKNPANYGFPSWFFNRRKDRETGNDLHLIGSDLLLAIRNDIEFLKRIKCWRGLRHAWGLKVRGQRTRSTGRKGRTVGVMKRRKK